MPSSTAALLLAIAPEVSARADSAVWLEIAAAQLTAAAFGAMYATACCYLAAHLATLSPLTAAASSATAGTAGAITAKGARDLSESYGSTASGVSGLTAGDAALMQTKYGREFIRIRNTRAASSPYVTGR